MNLEINQKPFCLAPWVHSHINEDGRRYLCCIADKNSSPSKDITEPFDEYWNSVEMRDVRKKMMLQTPPPECLTCVRTTSKQVSYRDNFEKEYTSMWPEISKKTDQNGFYKNSPIDFDYRINNICNLSCRMCSSEFSSTIRSLETQAQLSNTGVTRSSENKQKMESELSRLVMNSETRHIYFADGEPLLAKLNWKILDQLVEFGHSKNVNVLFNTNLTQFRSQIERIRNILNKFKRVQFIVSIDGTGDTQEFVRSGVNWEQWLSNFQDIKSLVGSKNIIFNVTFTIPLLLNLKPLLDFLKIQNIRFHVNTVKHNQSPEVILCPTALPKQARALLVKNALSEVPDNSFFDQFRYILSGYLEDNSMDLRSEENRLSLVMAFRYHMKVDFFRGKISLVQFYFENPILKDWIIDILSFPTALYILSENEVSKDFLQQPKSRDVFYLKYVFRNVPLREEVQNYINKNKIKILIIDESRLSLLNLILLKDLKNNLFFAFRKKYIFQPCKYTFGKSIALPLEAQAVFKSAWMIQHVFPFLNLLSGPFPWLFGMHVRTIAISK